MKREFHGRKLLATAGIGAIIALQLFLLMPTILYAGNAEEFSTPLWSIIALYFKPAIFLVAAVSLAAMLLSQRWSDRFYVALAALSALLWLQGSLLVWDYGLLDGRSIDWTSSTWRGWVDGAVWCLVLSVALFAPARIAKAMSIAAVVGFMAMGATAASVVINQSDDLRGREIGDGSKALRQMFRFSADRNVLHIVMDGFQGDVFSEIVEEGELGQQITSALNGFVFFPEHMGAFPFTHMSVPTILSGQLYGNEQPRDRFLDGAVGKEGATILNAASEAGFEVDLAIASGLEHLYARGAADNIYPVGSALHATPREFAIQHAATLFDLSLFRMLPHVLKPWVYNDQKWLAQRLLVEADYMNLRFFSHMAFVDLLRERMTADRPDPVYKLMHLMVSHTPFATTLQCRYAGRVLPTERITVTAQARCGLIKVIQLLERMKQLGIYDSSTIVLMADHGAWIPPVELKPVDLAVRTQRSVDPITVAMAVPMFAIKPPGANGPLRISSAPSWIVDTAPTIASAAGIAGSFGGLNALELQADSQRERFFRTYEYRRSEWSADYLTPIIEYSVQGSVLDSAAWSYRRTLMPPVQALNARE